MHTVYPASSPHRADTAVDPGVKLNTTIDPTHQDLQGRGSGLKGCKEKFIRMFSDAGLRNRWLNCGGL